MTTVQDGEGVPDQSERSESFERVTPLSISAVNGGGGNDHLGAHAWWADFAGLDPRFSASQTDPQYTNQLDTVPDPFPQFLNDLSCSLLRLAASTMCMGP